MTRVLRVYHAGRDAGHRRRERALVAAGVDLTLVVPTSWPDSGAEKTLSSESFPVVEVPVRRVGDVNRHQYIDRQALADIVATHRPDVIDIHEEPFSLAARQWLQAAGSVPVLMYTAQNLDKRFPPPFAQYEKQALRRIHAMYPCSRQAASVARGKGFDGLIEPLPLGYDSALYAPGAQSLADDILVIGIVGRLVQEKGVCDAVRVLAAIHRHRPVRLHIVGTGPELEAATRLARDLGIEHAIQLTEWVNVTQMAELYRTMHVVLIPSRATSTWVEQFGRVIPEAQSSGAVIAGYTSGAIAEVAGSPGVLVPEGAIDQLTAAVLDLVTSAQDWHRRRTAGLAHASDFTWASIAQHQAALYEAVSTSPRPLTPRHLGPARRRQAARNEFGQAASTARKARPMALPVLRKLSRLESGLGQLIDLTAECRSLFSRR